MVRITGLFLSAMMLLGTAGITFGADIVTVPTANQLRQGQADAAYYFIGLDLPPGAPDNVQVQTAYLGLTDRIEIDLHRYDIDTAGDATIINASVLLRAETPVTPDIVIGGRNIGGSEVGGDPESDKASWYIAAAKTLKLPAVGPPTLPIIRLHAALGTKDHTLLGEDRHKGLFGGVQMLFTPEIGLVALHDSQDLITGLTYTPENTGLTLKGGTYGDHWWVGISWAK
jgi:hypothetical protein